MKVKRIFATNAYLIGILLLTMPVAGCGGINAAAQGSPTVTIAQTGTTGSAPTPSRSAKVYDDPFAYCAAVVVADVPDTDSIGPGAPDAIARAMLKLYPAVRVDMLKQSNWRCMDGKVMACFIGANRPCGNKADTSRTPSAGAKRFCRVHPDADAIPMYATGRETVYEWRCMNGEPTPVRQIQSVDVQGYPADIWNVLSP